MREVIDEKRGAPQDGLLSAAWNAKGKSFALCYLSPGPASVIDPCVGQGTALQLVTSDAPVRRYGIELDAERARIASSKGIETIQGNTFDAIAKPESFSLLYLNPPYDSEIGTIGESAHGGCVPGTYLPLVANGRRSDSGDPV